MSEKSDQFSAGLYAFLRNVAAVVTAVGIIFGAITLAVRPALDKYVEGLSALQVEPVIARLDGHKKQLTEIGSAVDIISNRVGKEPPFIEFNGHGIIASIGPFSPGEIVPIEYFLKRNSPCATKIDIRFFSAERGRILTNFTTEIRSTQAQASFGFIPFTADVKLPETLPDGLYSYRPVMRPDTNECPGQTELDVPPSVYFLVQSDEDDQ